MRACEIHLAACDLYDGPLRWPSVKDALSAYTRGGDRRFRRLRRGAYQLAREGPPSTVEEKDGASHDCEPARAPELLAPDPVHLGGLGLALLRRRYDVAEFPHAISCVADSRGHGKLEESGVSEAKSGGTQIGIPGSTTP
jgi:hypothetical protein